MYAVEVAVSSGFVFNNTNYVHAYDIKPSKYPDKGSDFCLFLQISIDGKKYVAFSIAKILMETIQKVPDTAFPFSTKIINNNDSYEFS